MKENTNTVLKNQADNEGRFDAFVTPTLNTFYNDDCMNWLPKCPPDFFELAIVDPPYMENNKALTTLGKKRTAFNVESFSPPTKDYFTELFRVSKNQIIWGGNYFDLPISRGWVCWDKMNAMDKFSDFELAWTSFDVTTNLFKYCNNGGFIVSGMDAKIHPTQKPIKLYKWLLRTYAKAGDKILDTHAGSASCLVACKEMGFDYVGFEIDKDYWTIANERLGRAYYQPELFGRSG